MAADHMKHRYKLLAVLAPLPMMGIVHAAQWDVADSLTLGLSYSDNLSLEAQGDAGFILNATPSLSLDGKGGRATVGFSYSPSLIYYPSGVANGDDVRLAHVLDATMNAELYRQTLFLDASTTASFSNISSRGVISDSFLNQNSNQVQTYTLRLSPYSTIRLGGEAVLETRYSFGKIIYDSSEVEDSTTHNINVSVSNALRSSPLSWSTNAGYSTANTGSVDSSSYSLTGTLGYRFNATWALSGTAGYQNADVVTSRSDTSGLVWSFGPSWTPNPRTDMNLQYGQSYFGSTWDVNFNHRSRRTEMQISYSRGLTNARNFAAVPAPIGIGLIYEGVNPTTPSLTGEDFVNDSLSGQLTLQGRRTTLGISLDYTLRSFEVSGNKEWLFAIGMTGQRELSNALSMNASLYWQHIDPPGLGDSAVTTASMGLSRSVGRHSSLNLDFQHRQQTGDVTTGYTENRISATFQTRFL